MVPLFLYQKRCKVQSKENQEVTLELGPEIPEVYDFNLYLVGKVCEEMSNRFIPDLFNLAETIMTLYPDAKSRPPITVTISTYGGDLVEMFALYDAIKRVQSFGIAVETLGLGKVMSSGLILIAAGTKGMRLAGRYTRFMFHEVNGSFEGTQYEIAGQKAELDFCQVQYLKVLCKETKKSETFYAKKINQHVDIHFDAEEAIKWHLIDAIDE